MDFMKALSFPFDDEEWLKKVGLGVLIQLIPIVGSFALQGWSFEIAKRVKNNDPVPLPDWDDFGGKLGKGFMIFLAYLIYQIPTIIFACVVGFAPTILAAGGDSEEALAALGSVAAIVASCCGCLLVIYAIVAALVFMAGFVRYLDTEEFGTFMQIGDNFSLLRENLGDFGMLILYFFLVGLIIGVASTVTLGLAGLVSTPVMMYFSGHLLGQLAAKLSGTSIESVPAV